MDNMYYGETFRVKRKTMGLTQQQLSDRIDRSVKTISNLENGKPIKTDTLFVIMDNLNLAFTDKENENKKENKNDND